MDPVRQLWSQAVFKSKIVPPKILYATNASGENFIVLEDHGTIFRIMNKQGQVFMVAGFRCTVDPMTKTYICNNPLHIVSCTKYNNEVDRYAHDVILPMVFS